MESSIDIQKRVGCNVWRGVDNWSCYRDCAFWNREERRCTYNEEHDNNRE